MPLTVNLNLMFRVFDVCFSLLGLLAFSPIICVLVVIGYFDTGSPLFIQMRLGKNQVPFKLYKLRTMKLGTASVPSHLSSRSTITSYGQFLRRTKLDELPQLYNVLLGDMSLVGPRPGLLNHRELTAARELWGVFKVRPGITGLSQVNEIDMSTPVELAKMDATMIESLTIGGYFKYLFLTIIGNGQGDRVR